MSALAGGGVDCVGDTGVVSIGSPFKRLDLTSANLHGCTGTCFFFYSSDWVMANMDRTLFKYVVYHGLISSVSAWVSLRCCNQLQSPFSLVRTWVVRNTAALSPSETQTRACHIPTHHLRYYTHCRLHHNDILITACLIECMIFTPLRADTQHIITHLYFELNQGNDTRSEFTESSAWRRDTPSDALCFHWMKHVIAHSDQTGQPSHLLTWLF